MGWIIKVEQYIARPYLSAKLVQFLYNNGDKLLTIATIM